MIPASSSSVFPKAIALVLLSAVAAAGQDDRYSFAIRTIEEFERLSIEERGLPGVDRVTKFLAPASDDPELLPVLFQDVGEYRFHQEFLAAEFPDRFPGLSGEEYLALVERRATRSYFAGILVRFLRATGDVYAFDVFTASGEPDELPLLDEVAAVHRALSPVFDLGDLAYAPRDQRAIANAREWTAAPFPIDFSFSELGDATYLPYTLAANFGRVRVLDAEGLAAANDSGGLSWQDIVVVEDAPADIEGVIAGVVTGGIQSELGHLAIRTARRGTPNAFVRDATEVFAPHDGELVFLEVLADRYAIRPATLAEAEDWWESHRPDVADAVRDVDAAHRALDATGEVELDESAVARYGGKGASFLRLYALLEDPHRVPGFVVPFVHYLEFLESNTTPSRADPDVRVTLAEYLEALLVDPGFQGDSSLRHAELERLRGIIEDGEVSDGLVRAVAIRVASVFGETTRTVRFRSSSNAEDLLEFNGAGLYRSTSVCAADDLDGDDVGPSRCNVEILPREERERGVARGLKAVWASLWNFRAYEEREYFQIPHERVRMAVLVSEGFPDELANGVAFTGVPNGGGDRRYLVNAQIGDVPVVFTDPGVIAEKTLLEVSDGSVTDILRVRPSSLAAPGTFVLEDESLRELGGLMALVERGFPIDAGEHDPADVLLDFEFKLDRATGRIRLKQVRTFLDARTVTPAVAEFRLSIPEGTTMCASFALGADDTFREGRPAVEVLGAKARVGLRAIDGAVVRSGGTSRADVFEWLELASGGPPILPLGPGVWTSQRVERPVQGLRYSTYQDFRVGDEIARVALRGLLVPDGDPADGPPEVVLDPPALTWATGRYDLHVDYILPAGGDPLAARSAWLLPCHLDHLPRTRVEVELATGDRMTFEEDFLQLTVGTGPAELASARIEIAGDTRQVDDYWRLVYSAGHHNDTPRPELWAILDPPIDVPGVGRVAVAGVAQNFLGLPPYAFLLDAELGELDRPEIVFLRRVDPNDQAPPQFRRGDADGSGGVSISDAVTILRHLFAAEELDCLDAADFEDNGSVEIGDAIQILFYLFLGLDPPAEPGPRRCGEDPTIDDALGGCETSGCA